MAIETNKPLPLEVNGSYHYTLSSTDPVEIEITTPRTTDEDLNFALERFAFEHGKEASELTDDWVAGNLGLATVDALKDTLRKELEHANENQAEAQKLVLTADALASRLEQKIPPEVIAQFKDIVRHNLELDAQRTGLSLPEFMNAMGLQEAALDELARVSAEREAAFGAYADAKKIEVEELELANLMGIDQKQAQHVIEQAREKSDLDKLLQDARPKKAANIVSAQAKITYNVESPEAAQERATHYGELIEVMHKGLKDRK